MEIKKLIKYFLLILIITGLSLPVLQENLHLFKIIPLKGAITLPSENKFSLTDWFKGNFQKEKEKYVNEMFGLRNIFVRINNQLYFSIFKKAKANGVVIGKKNYLYELNYIKAYYGIDFIGQDLIRERMQKIKLVCDTLKKMNKDIVLVFASGKGSFYPEYIPDSFYRKNDHTNLEYYVKYANEYKLNYIDFNRYFIEQKSVSKYPLYPQYGIHWSYYGMCLAGDSIIKYIEKLRNIDMPDYTYKNIQWDYPQKSNSEMGKPQEDDYDVANGMNLLFELKTFQMAYPEIVIEEDAGKSKPNVIVISDSFYWGLFNSGLPRCFNQSQFWFYNKQIYPESFNSPLEVNQIDISKTIGTYDVFIFISTDANLSGFGWGCIEYIYNLFYSG